MWKVGELRGNSNPNAVANDEYVFSYDNLDRLLTVTDTANFAANPVVPNAVPAIPVMLTHTYNTQGDLATTRASVKFGGGSNPLVNDFLNTFGYDNLGRMTQIVQSGTAGTGQPPIARKRVDIGYKASGDFASIVRSVGAAGSETEVATGTYSYFANGGLASIAYTHSGASLTGQSGFPTLPTGSAVSAYSWTYDPAGLVDIFGVNSGTYSYSYDYDYDNVHQLTKSDFTLVSGQFDPDFLANADETFAYDANGNEVSEGQTYDHDHLLTTGTGISTTTYAYDSEGNLVSTVTTSNGQEIMKWDPRNRLTSVEFKDSTGATTKYVLYTYDAFDRRVAKQVDGNGDLDFLDTTSPDPELPPPDRHERYVWDGDEVALVLDGTNGNIQHRFLHGPAIDQVFADEFASGSNSILHWYLGDNQNTTRDVVDSNGTVVDHLTYSAFGKIAAETEASITPFFAYTGREWDEDTGLQYNRRRWYDPELGRWISEDPIRFQAGDTNLYRYVSNSATNFIDPDGLAIQEPIFSGNNVIIHVYEPDGWFHSGEWLGTVTAKKDNLELARCLAKRIYLAKTLEELRDLIAYGVVHGVELAIRTVSDPIDNIASAVEFAQDPSLQTAAGMLPFVPGGVRKLDDAAKSGRKVDNACTATKRPASNPPQGRFDFEHPSYDDALESARRHAGDLGGNTRKMYDPPTGTLIGEMSADGKRGWRIDQDHVNYWDWTAGKKGSGGKYGHDYFPPSQGGPHSKYPGYSPWGN